MAMLTPDVFWMIYGRDAKVYDATGRLLTSIAACDPTTGEVITYDMPWIARAWAWLMWATVPSRQPFSWRWGNRIMHLPYSGYLISRHGFWPAPLRVVAPRVQP